VHHRKIEFAESEMGQNEKSAFFGLGARPVAPGAPGAPGAKEVAPGVFLPKIAEAILPKMLML
jgi:hypothetical protein